MEIAMIITLIVVIVSIGTFLKTFRIQEATDEYFSEDKYKRSYFDALEKLGVDVADVQSVKPEDLKILKDLLFKRALEASLRLILIEDEKGCVYKMNDKGLLDDRFLNMFLTAESKLKEEIINIKFNAEFLSDGWGNTIFNKVDEVMGKCGKKMNKDKKPFKAIKGRKVNVK